MVQVDRLAGKFEVIALNQLGIKLFDVKGDRGNVSLEYVLPPLAGLKDILVSIGWMWSGCIWSQGPGGYAKTVIESDRILYFEKTPDGTVGYEFGAIRRV